MTKCFSLATFAQAAVVGEGVDALIVKAAATNVSLSSNETDGKIFFSIYRFDSLSLSVSVSVDKPSDGDDSKGTASNPFHSFQSRVVLESTDVAKPFDHDHQEHHEHESTVTIDLHNLVDLIKQLFQSSEKRIIAAVSKGESSSSSASTESYRTADRKGKKDEKKKKAKKVDKKKEKEDSDED